MKYLRQILLFFFAAANTFLVAQNDYKKTGYASFYHDKFEGRKTSSGEKFRQKKMTCAHRALPFGTKVKVTNLANSKTVVVTVNDRGPYAKGRIIDLSKAAARELDFIKAGVTKVTIEVLGDTIAFESVDVEVDSSKHYIIIDSSETGFKGFSVQVGFFTEKGNMIRVAKHLKQISDVPVYAWVKSKDVKNGYRVLSGRFKTQGDAFGHLEKIIAAYPGAFIIEFK